MNVKQTHYTRPVSAVRQLGTLPIAYTALYSAILSLYQRKAVLWHILRGAILQIFKPFQ